MPIQISNMKKTKAVLYVAPWCGGCVKMKPEFYKECKANGVDFEIVDVETPEGVKRSIKNSVRNVPTIIFVRNGREVGREKGNTSYLKIADYA